VPNVQPLLPPLAEQYSRTFNRRLQVRSRKGAPPPEPVEASIAERIAFAWAHRPCFVCGNSIACRHREYEVEVAMIEAQDRRRRGC
jgi:hypothetical protein